MDTPLLGVCSMRLYPLQINMSRARLGRLLLVATCVLTLAAARADTSVAPVPPGYTLAGTGDAHDFDYFAGAWTTKQHRLKARGVGSQDWEDFPATLCMTPYPDLPATVDELYVPSKKLAGLTLRTFDGEKRQWWIHWVSSAIGKLDPAPLVGGFQGNHGEFYAPDHDGNRPVKVRFQWDKIDHDHARWQQAFSYDDKTWETNWIADFTRAEPSKVCAGGVPRHT
jgi:hypothetical protein